MKLFSRIWLRSSNMHTLVGCGLWIDKLVVNKFGKIEKKSVVENLKK